MFGIIRKRLGYKIMAAMLVIILLVLLAEIYMRIYFGTKDRLEIAASLSTELADSIYSASSILWRSETARQLNGNYWISRRK